MKLDDIKRGDRLFWEDPKKELSHIVKVLEPNKDKVIVESPFSGKKMFVSPADLMRLEDLEDD